MSNKHTANMALGKATRAEVLASGNIQWTAIQGKPTTYPPNAHTHGVSSITGGITTTIQVVIQASPEVKQTLTFTNGILTGA